MTDETDVVETSHSADTVKRLRWIGCAWLMYPLSLQIVSSGVAAEVPCANRLMDFAKYHALTFDLTHTTVGPRWVAAGHEVRKLPGHTVRIPVDACDGTVAVDFAPDCQILKNRGENGCRAKFPLTFH